MDVTAPDPVPVPLAAPKFPGIVMAAGIIWIIFGGLILMSLLAVAVLIPILVRGVDAGAALAGLASVAGCLGLFGGVFVMVGVQTVRGTAKDTMGNGVGSILFGLLNGMNFDLQGGGLGLALVVAGILAIVGRADYKEWRRGRKALAAA